MPTGNVNREGRQSVDSYASVYTGSNVTTSDTVANVFDAIYVGGAGDGTLKVTTAGGSIITFVGIGIGWHPISTKLIWATGTGVTNIVGANW